MMVSILMSNALSSKLVAFSIKQMQPLTWIMLPLTSGSRQRNLFLIQESTVLTSKCNSAPQAAVISSVIMAENGREGNQINRSMMDRWDGRK